MIRRDLIKKLHSSHIGITGCINRAREVMYWPGMTKQIQEAIELCSICNQFKKSQPREPLKSHPIPKRPWQRVGGDIFELNNKHYLILVDYFSSFVEIAQLTSQTSKNVIRHCKNNFARYGIPDTLVVDCGS